MALRAADAARSEPLARWARRGGWPLLDDAAWARAPLVLEPMPAGLELVGRAPPLLGRARVDLVHGRLGARLRRGTGTREPLARAVGAREGRRPPVIDLTLGWARDAAVLAALGCPVLALERSPVMAALIEDGLARAADEPALAPLLARLTWRHADALPFLSDGSAFHPEHPDEPPVLLLDPMFPDRTGSALVQLPLRLAAAVVGPDADADALLRAALGGGARRVVVRRPRRAPSLDAGRAPDLVVPGGRTTRFDVYLGPASARD